MNEFLSTDSGDFLNELPLQPHELEAVKSYFSGGLGKDTASAAFHRLLANPTWIMGAFANNSGSLKKLTDWIRVGGSNFVRDLSAGI